MFVAETEFLRLILFQMMFDPIFLSLIFSFQKDRDNAKAANAAGEEAEEDVSSGDEPEGKQVNDRVAVILSASHVFLETIEIQILHLLCFASSPG